MKQERVMQEHEQAIATLRDTVEELRALYKDEVGDELAAYEEEEPEKPVYRRKASIEYHRLTMPQHRLDVIEYLTAEIEWVMAQFPKD